MSAEPVTATRGREVVLGALRVVEDRLVEGRRPGEHRHVFRGHPGQHPVDVEDGFGQHGGSAGDAGENAGLEAEHVEVRIHLQVDVAGVEAGHRHPVRGDNQRAAVRHHHALGHPRGPGGEEDVGGIVRPERGAPSSTSARRPGWRSPRRPATTTPNCSPSPWRRRCSGAPATGCRHARAWRRSPSRGSRSRSRGHGHRSGRGRRPPRHP